MDSSAVAIRRSGPGAGERFTSVSSYDQAFPAARGCSIAWAWPSWPLRWGSYGGMVALAFAEALSDRTAPRVVISAVHRTHRVDRLAQRANGHRALRARTWRRAAGARARAGIAMATYRSRADGIEERLYPAGGARPRGFRFTVESTCSPRRRLRGAIRPKLRVLLSESIDLHRVDPAAIHVRLPAGRGGR